MESANWCTEIGCGAGRVTRQLALYFDWVYAVDVSSDMISRAQNAIKVGKVEFSVIDGLNLPQDDSSVSGIFSAHVLQHLDSEEIGHSLLSGDSFLHAKRRWD